MRGYLMVSDERVAIPHVVAMLGYVRSQELVPQDSLDTFIQKLCGRENQAFSANVCERLEHYGWLRKAEGLYLVTPKGEQFMAKMVQSLNVPQPRTGASPN